MDGFNNVIHTNVYFIKKRVCINRSEDKMKDLCWLMLIMVMVGCSTSGGMTSEERAADERAALKSLSQDMQGVNFQ